MEDSDLNLQNENNKTEKEKIRYKIVIPISILIAALITSIWTCVTIIKYNTKTSNSHNYFELNARGEVLAHNGQFTGYFGEEVSASDVKALSSLIRSNNITSQTVGETKTIAIKFNQRTDTATIKTPSAVSRSVISGKTYWVGVENEEKCASDEDPTSENAIDVTSAYYTSGFLRIISIKENN